MKKIVQYIMVGAVLGLSACQTTAAPQSASAEHPLYAGLSGKVGAASARSEQSPTCITFYSNAASYAAKPSSGAAMGVIKTLGLGLLSGVAAGGVGALGISSSFAELALAGAANQMAYKGGEAVLNKATGEKEDSLTPMQEVQDAAANLGCPPPTKAVMKAAKKGTKALTKKDGDN